MIHKQLRVSAPLLGAVILMATLGTTTSADRLHLESGGYIDTDSWWIENDWLMYEHESGTIGIPRSTVVRIEQGHSPESPAPFAKRSGIELKARSSLQADRAVADRFKLEESLEKGGAALQSRDYETASSHYMNAINAAPDLTVARVGYALSEIALGRDGMALSIVLDGLARDPDSPRLRELLGDLRYREELVDDALREWRKAFEADPGDRLRDKIFKGERELHASRGYDFTATAHFNMRYDGEVDWDLASAVMEYLEDQFWIVANAYRHSPPQPITVQLFPTREFREVTQAPEWVGGLYDGKIRVPLGGLSRLNHRAKEVLIHELTHAVVHSKSRGNCPRWLHEGLAQAAEDKRVLESQRKEIAERLRDGEPSDWDKAGFSYPMALSLTRHLESRLGFDGLVHLLEILGEGKELDEALRQTYGEDYADVCRRWKRELLAKSGR